LAARALLAVALMIGYYVLAVGVSAALLWIPYAEFRYLERVDFRIAAACVVGAGTILWALVPRPDHFEKPGPQLTPSTAPELFAVIDNVAAATSQPRPSEVFLLNEVNAWVTQRGGTMGFGSRRVMGVGLPLVNSLTRAELEAVIAHEFGHYVGGDVGLGPWIYKTRAAIGRTMAGLDQSYLQWIFNAYGRMFMRLTMAVSRQQEFVADETAARISGSGPMVSALQKVAMLAPAYSVYLQHEVLPVLRSGFLPPLAEGFDRFIASPETRTAFDKMAREQTTGDVAEEFDTHPPLSERVAALERLQTARVAGSAESSLPMLKNPEKHARLLLEHNAGADSVRQLNAITWDDVGDSIYAKEWHRLADAHVAAFGAMTIGNLPAGNKAYTELGAGVKSKGESFVDADERLGRAAHVIIAGLGAALLRAGWRIETGPGRPLELKNGESSVIPREVVGRLIEHADSHKEWKARAAAMGISDIPLANPTPSAN
jgi:Zn-dependent protease with chaperone function